MKPQDYDPDLGREAPKMNKGLARHLVASTLQPQLGTGCHPQGLRCAQVCEGHCHCFSQGQTRHPVRAISLMVNRCGGHWLRIQFMSPRSPGLCSPSRAVKPVLPGRLCCVRLYSASVQAGRWKAFLKALFLLFCFLTFTAMLCYLLK